MSGDQDRVGMTETEPRTLEMVIMVSWGRFCNLTLALLDLQI